MVFVLVAVFSYIYISHRLRQSTTEAYSRADFIAKEIEESAREATQVNLHELGLEASDPAQVQQELERASRKTEGLHTLLQSILAYSFAVYDAGITDSHGRVIVHTDSSLVGTKLKPRENYSDVLSANFFHQLRIIYGPPKVYDLYVPIRRGSDEQFGIHSRRHLDCVPEERAGPAVESRAVVLGNSDFTVADTGGQRLEHRAAPAGGDRTGDWIR